MRKPIAKITKENHLNNLISNLPLFTIIYGVQCALAHYFFRDIVDPGSFAIILGATIIGLISCLYAYDKYHHIIIYQDKLQVYLELFGSSQTIPFSEIKEIIVPAEECDFASMTLVLKNDQQIDFHFIDYPVQVKEVLLSLNSENEFSSGSEAA